MVNPNQIILDRQKLYDEVWEDPVVVVARRYAISDVGLAKICNKLSIPLPTRGYWAKVKAGRIMKKIPLPKIKENHPQQAVLSKIDPVRKAAETVARQKIGHGGASEEAITVPTELVNPHPLVKVAGKRLKQRNSRSEENGLCTAPDEVLHLQVTRPSLDRALLVADTLLKALEKHSISVSVDAQRKETLLSLHGTLVPFCITERIERTSHQETPAEKRAKERYWKRSLLDTAMPYPHVARYDYHPTGILTISAGRWPSRNWNDTSRTPLEKRMTEVVTGLIALIEETRAKEEEEARQKEERRLREERYAFLVQRHEQELARFKKLETDAINWERANRLRHYIAAHEQKLLAGEEMPPDQADWILWALAKADWLDPMVQVCDPILDAPETKRPGYH